MFLSIIFLFDAYFSLISTYFCFIFLVDQCFSFRSTFLLLFFWLMFCSESLEQLDEDKKGNKNFFSFFYHLLRSILFSIIFVFRGYFSIRSTYFCLVFFFSDFLFFVDKCVGSRFFSQIYCLMDFFFSDLFC